MENNCSPQKPIYIDINVDIKYGTIVSYGFTALIKEYSEYSGNKVDCNFKTDTMCIFECSCLCHYIDFLCYIEENYKIYSVLLSPYKCKLVYEKPE